MKQTITGIEKYRLNKRDSELRRVKRPREVLLQNAENIDQYKQYNSINLYEIRKIQANNNANFSAKAKKFA